MQLLDINFVLYLLIELLTAVMTSISFYYCIKWWSC